MNICDHEKSKDSGLRADRETFPLWTRNASDLALQEKDQSLNQALVQPWV